MPSLSGLSSNAAELLMVASTIALAAIAFAFMTARSLRRQNQRLSTALDNMSQGLCMLDAEGRVVVFNRRYLEMYGLSDERVYIGCPLRTLIEMRTAVGSFSGSIDAYVETTMREIAAGIPTNKILETPDGRVIALANRPMNGGAWVGTHEDITEQRAAERRAAVLTMQEGRRMALEEAALTFREGVATALKTVADGAGAMRQTAMTLSASSQQTTKRAEGASIISREATSNVSAAAVAAEELLASIVEIGRQLDQAANVVRVAVSEADSANEEVSGLAHTAGLIGSVVKLIQDIAGQTNLLALNAAIEAARAGESGRGFAVVAAEVKTLAVQTARATEDIAAQIAAVQKSSGEAVEAIRRIGGRMQEINQHTSSCAASLQQQNMATDEISHNVASASQGAAMFDAVLNEVSGAAAETYGSARSMLTAAEAVESASSDLRNEVERFLMKVAV